MKLIFKITLYSLFIFSSIQCMEEKLIIERGIVTPSMYISFIEAFLSGGNFCVHTDTNMIEFKHFRKEKHFYYPISNLEQLIGTSDLFSIKDAASNHARPLFEKPCTPIKLRMLELQRKRLCTFNQDPLFDESEEYLSQDFIYKKLKELFLQSTSTPDGCTKLKKQVFKIEEEAEKNWSLPFLLHFRTVDILERNKNRQQLRQALLEKSSSKLIEAGHKFIWINYDLLIHESQLQEHLEFIKQFAGKYPHLKYFISFLDEALQGQRFDFDPEKQTLQAKHFKKDKVLTATLFVTQNNIHRLFEENYKRTVLDDAIHYISNNIHTKTELLEKLSLLNQRQRKIFVLAFRFNRYFYFDRWNGPYIPQNRSDIKKDLKKMAQEEHNLLDGFNEVFSNTAGSVKRKLHVYAGMVLKKIRNQQSWRNFMNEKKADLIAEFSVPLAIEFIPFQEEFEHLESEIIKLEKQ